MKNVIRFAFVALIGYVALSVTGCASKSGTQKQLNSLNAQMGVVTEELVRLDQNLQDTRAAVQNTQSAPSPASYAVESTGGSAIYRTPSGFELPAISIQQALKNAGYYSGALDGKIGSGTKNSIRSFQRDNGLEADGVVGRGTWSKLKVYLGASGK